MSDGEEAQNRTYQDLLSNTNDQYNFKQLVRADLVKVDHNGNTQSWSDTDMYSSVSYSPDGEYEMVTIIEEPFSYQVTYSRFPSDTDIYDQ